MEETLFHAAHLESRQIQYQKAAQRIADRAAQAKLQEDISQFKNAADEENKRIIGLEASKADIDKTISELSAKRTALLAELKEVEESLEQATQEKAKLPDAIQALEKERNIQARKALALKKKIKPIEGDADADTREVEEANQIRLRAISSIQSFLGR